MLIECCYCESKVDAQLVGEVKESFPEEYTVTTTALVVCPACKRALVAEHDRYQTGSETWEVSDPKRVWPFPENSFDRCIPPLVRDSLDEARRCYKAKAFSACVVMCGRAIEALCVAYCGEKTLHKGLAKLKEKGIVDGRLFEWGDSLRQERNVGAHATDRRTTNHDAKDLLEFALAICEYVYVLSEKYNKYITRKNKRDDQPNRREAKEQNGEREGSAQSVLKSSSFPRPRDLGRSAR